VEIFFGFSGRLEPTNSFYLYPFTRGERVRGLGLDATADCVFFGLAAVENFFHVPTSQIFDPRFSVFASTPLPDNM